MDTRTKTPDGPIDQRDATLDAQSAVIGALLIDPGPVAPLVMDRLQAEDFSKAEYRHLFEAAR